MPQAPPGEAAAGEIQPPNEGEQYVNIGKDHRFDTHVYANSSARLRFLLLKRLHALVPASEGVDCGRWGARSNAQKVAALLKAGLSG